MRDITGTIPNATEWGQLTNLLELSLSAPSFDPSPFPAYLTKVTTLEVLSISASHVTGTIPTSIGNLTNLRTLLLEFNEFAAGTMPTELGLLTELGVLMIQDGALEGQLPSELGHLSKLELMSLAMNKLTGTVPTELGNLVVLSNLVVQRNRMHGNIPTEMCALSELGVFGYDRCGSKQATDLCLQNTCDGKPSWGEAQT
jgi:Leucine-rich repeat (LRR) protein